MEYGEFIYDSIKKSDLYTQYVGYQDTNVCIEKYFSGYTVNIISKKVTELLMGVHPENRRIIVPDSTIYNVLDAIYQNYRPPTGYIYGRYNIPSGTTTESYVQDMIDQVIEVITSNVKNSLGMEENNRKLSIWTTVYGDFNEHSLRAHAPIKVRNKRPQPFMFNMHY